jgi:hypothetical protein
VVEVFDVKKKEQKNQDKKFQSLLIPKKLNRLANKEE